MGNYLQNLRVPPATPGEREHERHHPLYYDWSLPKWSPFRTDLPTQTTPAGKELADSASANIGSNSAAAAESADRNTERRGNKTQPPASGLTSSSGGSGGKLAVAAKSAIKTAKEAIQKGLKSTLTSTVDRADSKPANADKTTSGAAKKSGNHRQTTREAAHATSSMRKSSSGHLPSTIKKVDSTRPQTIDPARNGGIDDQAALKAATNIHTVGTAAASSSTRKRVPAN